MQYAVLLPIIPKIIQIAKKPEWTTKARCTILITARKSCSHRAPKAPRWWTYPGCHPEQKHIVNAEAKQFLSGAELSEHINPPRVAVAADRKQQHPVAELRLQRDYGPYPGLLRQCGLQPVKQLSWCRGFNLIEEETNHATMVKQKKRSILDLINCLNFGGSDEGVTAVKIQVKTNEAKAVRVAKLRGLVGAREQVKRFLDEFKNKSKALKESVGSYF